jgi:uncharacterized protein (TIGR03437 family)
MPKQRKIFWAKTAVIMSAIPLLIWAHEYGPDAGYCGVPKELGTCLNAACHSGTLNGSTGSVAVTFAGGSATYTPGVKQHLVVTISDSAATQGAWGFQLTARNDSDTATMAGSFASTDAKTTLMCAPPNLAQEQEEPYNGGKAQTCPASMTLQYIEHSLQGYMSTLNQHGSASYEFDWTPPATNVGNIDLYVAGNAGPGGPVPVSTNAHIYTNKITVSPVTGAVPAISSGGVVSASAFGGFSSIAPATWVEIYGSNLSTSTRGWAGSDFNGNNAPTKLDNVQVTIGGQPAFVDYISPGQVNAQVPSNVATGQQQITVTNSSGTSAAYNITVNAEQPGLLAPPSFNIGGKQYVVAQHASDNTFVLPPNSISGLTTRQAKPGETIIIYGIGFGPAKDSSNAVIPAGQIVTSLNQLVNAVTLQVNGVAANLAYAGLAPNYVGLYQFNAVVPSVPDNDAWPLTFTQNGTKGTQTLYLAVHQ